MLQKKEFLGYIKESNFYELFIESGWNNPQGDTNLGMVQDDDTSFCFEQIAERNGFKIVKCETAATPNSSQCKKIDMITFAFSISHQAYITFGLSQLIR